MYDVIIVGTGSAGSTVAKVLVEKGLHTLLAERHKLLRYKSCSDVLIQKAMDLLLLVSQSALLSASFQNVGFRRNEMPFFAGQHTGVMQPYIPYPLSA